MCTFIIIVFILLIYSIIIIINATNVNTMVLLCTSFY